MKELNIWYYNIVYTAGSSDNPSNNYGHIVTPCKDAATVAYQLHDEYGPGYEVRQLELVRENPIIRGV